MNQNHTLMEALGVNDENLDRIVSALREEPNILGAKTSGSGLGDCAVGLGWVDTWELPFEQIPCTMSTEGVRVE